MKALKPRREFHASLEKVKGIQEWLVTLCAMRSSENCLYQERLTGSDAECISGFLYSVFLL
jgi:hypothetical protein